MNLEKDQNYCDKEHNRLMKIINFRLPHKYKKIGIISAVLTFGFLIAFKFLGSNDIVVKDLCRTLMLAFLLLACLSKEVEEDEYINHIKSQSYILAFICATAYAIILPLVTLLLDLLITKVRNDGSVSFHEVSAFEVMFMLFCFQLLFFETLKRFGRAQ